MTAQPAYDSRLRQLTATDLDAVLKDYDAGHVTRTIVLLRLNTMLAARQSAPEPPRATPAKVLGHARIVDGGALKPLPYRDDEATPEPTVTPAPLSRDTMEKVASNLIRGLVMPWNRKRDEVIAEIVSVLQRVERTPADLDRQTQAFREALARWKQVIADDQFITGSAINLHVKQMFDELEAALNPQDQETY
jgi:hypothetical protein